MTRPRVGQEWFWGTVPVVILEAAGTKNARRYYVEREDERCGWADASDLTEEEGPPTSAPHQLGLLSRSTS